MATLNCINIGWGKGLLPDGVFFSWFFWENNWDIESILYMDQKYMKEKVHSSDCFIFTGVYEGQPDSNLSCVGELSGWQLFVTEQESVYLLSLRAVIITQS